MLDPFAEAAALAKTPNNDRMADLRRMRFGFWRVIWPSKTQGGWKTWICRCDCGSIATISGHMLLAGESVGCGGVQHVRDYLPARWDE